MRPAAATLGTLAASLLACVGGEPETRRPSDCLEDPSRPGCRREDPGCRGLPKSADCLDREYFRSVVMPIFERRCAVCHMEGGSAWGSTGLPLAAESAWDSLVDVPSVEMRSARAPMMRVRPGMPESSYLYLKISMPSPPVGGRMPLSETTLSQPEIAGIREWIEGRPYD